jgi:hypothetical protein
MTVGRPMVSKAAVEPALGVGTTESRLSQSGLSHGDRPDSKAEITEVDDALRAM